MSSKCLIHKPGLDRIAQEVHNLYMFKGFYDQMDFDTG